MVKNSAVYTSDSGYVLLDTFLTGVVLPLGAEGEIGATCGPDGHLYDDHGVKIGHLLQPGAPVRLTSTFWDGQVVEFRRFMFDAGAQEYSLIVAISPAAQRRLNTRIRHWKIPLEDHALAGIDWS